MENKKTGLWKNRSWKWRIGLLLVGFFVLSLANDISVILSGKGAIIDAGFLFLIIGIPLMVAGRKTKNG